ncbi:Uncharacterised protein [Algoriella xinjiangensis]|nr:Uncharacterised protein [Algoriella xinjiangensis]
MKTTVQINEFIKNYKIKNILLDNFEKLLKNNSEKQLDIIDKDIAINSKKIEYKKTENNFHSFQNSILRNDTEIGYYTLVFDNDVNLVDEYFVIFN